MFVGLLIFAGFTGVSLPGWWAYWRLAKGVDGDTARILSVTAAMATGVAGAFLPFTTILFLVGGAYIGRRKYNERVSFQRTGQSYASIRTPARLNLGGKLRRLLGR